MHSNEPHIASRLAFGIDTAPLSVLFRWGVERFTGDQLHEAPINTPILCLQDPSGQLSGADKDKRPDVPAIEYNDYAVTRDFIPILNLRRFKANHAVAGFPATADHMERNLIS